MKQTIAVILLSLSIVHILNAQTSTDRYWIAGAASNWNNTANWSTTSGGSGGASVPGATENIFFNANGLGNCTIDIAVAIQGLSVSGYSGTVDLNGKAFSVSDGNVTLSSGTITDALSTSSLNINTSGTSAFSGCIIDVPLNCTSAGISINGSTFNKVSRFTKTGLADDYGWGNSTFQEEVEFTNTSNGSWYLSYDYPDIFQGNIVLNNTGGGDITFGRSGGTATLADGKTISIGTNGFTGGALRLENFTQLGTTPQSLVLTGGNTLLEIDGNTTFNGNIDFTAGGIELDGGTYNGTVRFIKTGTIDDYGSGNNTFNQRVEILNTGTGSLYLSYYNPDIFQDDIVLNNTGGGAIEFGRSGGTTTLADGKTISVGTNGFTSGLLLLENFTQLGTTPQSLVLTGNNTLLEMEGNTTFNGNVDFTAGGIELDGGTYNGTARFTKTGSTVDDGSGNNTFNQRVEILNTGTGDMYLSYYSPDIFQDNIVLNNTGGGDITFGRSGGTATLADGKTISIGTNGFTGGALRIENFTQLGTTLQTLVLTGDNTILEIEGTTTFNGNVDFTAGGIELDGGTYNGTARFTKTGSTNDDGDGNNTFYQSVEILNTGTGDIYLSHYNQDIFQDNIVLNNTGGGDITFGRSGGTTTLTDGKTISVGTNGFTSGLLLLENFTQLGTTPQSLVLTGNNTLLEMEGNTTFNGNVNFTAGGIKLDGGTYNGTAHFTKTGSTIDYGRGNNTFNQRVEVLNTGTGGMNLSYDYSDIFQDNIVLNNTGGGDITFGRSGGTTTLVDGKTISIGTNGFTGGALRIENFTQLGTTPQTLVLTGNNTILEIDGNTTFNGNVNFTAGGIKLDGGTYNGTAHFTKTGSTIDYGRGNNTFNQRVEVLNTGTGGMNLSYDYSDIFQDNIVLNNTGGGSIRFGQSGGATTLADGKTISIGTSGFTGGSLRLNNFTQLSTTPQSLVLLGSTLLEIDGNTTFNGNVDFTAGAIELDGGTYNGTAHFTKTGSANDYSVGGNTFQEDAVFSNRGTGNLYLGNNTSDIFKADVTYIKTGSGALYPAYNTICSYPGNIHINSNSSIRFGASSIGNIIFNGNTAQSINDIGNSPAPIFRKLTINNLNDEITLNIPVEVSEQLTLTAGNILTDYSNILVLTDNAIVAAVSNDSYVDGPMEKIGNDAFTFPVGDSSYYRSIAISAPSSSSASFRAAYFETAPGPLYDDNFKEPGLNYISDCEYWILDRTAGSENVNVTLSWDTNSCGVASLANLRVARWDGSLWKDHGNGGTTETTTNGTIITASPVTSFSPFTLASSTSEEPLAIPLVAFNAQLNGDKVNLDWTTATEINNDYFTVEKSIDGKNFVEVARIAGAGNSSTTLNYATTDYAPYTGISYYRLKQTDFDGGYTYSKLVAINYSRQSNVSVSLFPNPASTGPVIIKLAGLQSNQTVEVSITDMLGKEVKRTALQTTLAGNALGQLDITDLPGGVYNVTVNYHYRNIAQKLILQ